MAEKNKKTMRQYLDRAGEGSEPRPVGITLRPGSALLSWQGPLDAGEGKVDAADSLFELFEASAMGTAFVLDLIKPDGAPFEARELFHARLSYENGAQLTVIPTPAAVLALCGGAEPTTAREGLEISRRFGDPSASGAFAGLICLGLDKLLPKAFIEQAIPRSFKSAIAPRLRWRLAQDFCEVAKAMAIKSAEDPEAVAKAHARAQAIAARRSAPGI